MKVLIADNEPMITDLVEVILAEKGGHAVVKAHHTQAAVDVAKDNPDIGLVLLDMDCLGGGSVTEALRTLCNECTIVLYSGGVVGDEDPKEFGVDAVISKLHYPPDLFQALAQACAA